MFLMAHESPQRRREDRQIAQLRHEVEDLKASLTWPRKNGDSWVGFVSKFFTLDRILLTVVLLYTVGGDVREFQYRVDDASQRVTDIEDRETSLQKQHAKISQDITDIAQVLARQDDMILKLQEQSHTTDARVAGLNEQVKQTVTRREFNEIRVLIQRLAKLLQ